VKIILKWILEEYDWVWTGFIWLCIGDRCQAVFDRMLGISWMAEQLLASEDGLRSVESVMYRILFVCPVFSMSGLSQNNRYYDLPA
jgi:hypothetical protein